tara:strand:+ start:595 stop:816 length:222 start_codon:yes stop_codon:yes gene_type:complete
MGTKIIFTPSGTTTVETTAAENAQAVKDAENGLVEKAARETEKAKRISGKQKLKDLGLDDDEIKAMGFQQDIE